MQNEVNFYKAENLQDLLYYLKTVNNLKVYGGGTSLYKTNKEITVDIADNGIFVSQCPECNFIEKTERYIDFGSGISLTSILNLGKNRIPSFFYQALKTVANPLVRNLATVTGNICTKNFYNTLYAPLLAVDAKLEIRDYLESKFVPLRKFEKLNPNQFITKIRLPIIDWDIEIFNRLGPMNELIDVSASYTFLARTEKDRLEDLRIAFCGKIKVCSQELEDQLIGCRLPIKEKEIEDTLEKASEIYDKELSYLENEKELVHPMLKSQFLNLLKNSLENLR
jgi:CO/xanthine dehydrogenase FAD-binding subunit